MRISHAIYGRLDNNSKAYNSSKSFSFSDSCLESEITTTIEVRNVCEFFCDSVISVK